MKATKSFRNAKDEEEKDALNLSNSLEAKSGELYKRSRKGGRAIFNNWQRKRLLYSFYCSPKICYCIVRKFSLRMTKICYGDLEADKPLRVSFPINSSTICEIGKFVGREFAFRLTTDSEEIILGTETEKDHTEWMEAINEVITQFKLGSKFICTQNGDIGSLKDIFKDMPSSIDDVDENGNTCLHIAAEFNQMEIVEYLLNIKCNLNVKNRKNETPVVTATIHGNADIADLLTESNCDLTIQHEEGTPQIIFYTMSNNPFIVTRLLDHFRVYIDEPDVNGFTALMAASYADNAMLVRLLLSRGANINCSNHEGDSPLLIAMANGCNTTAKLLIDNNCNIDQQAVDGDAALMIAVVKDMFELAEHLCSKYANCNLVNQIGYTALHIATVQKKLRFVNLLLK